jgi:hypothetical protein
VTSPPFPELAPDERELAAAWSGATEGTFSDRVDERIFWLVSRRLVLEGTANGGWDQLYRDPRDGRLWELTFPHGSLHGGGPRRLAQLSRQTAEDKYGIGKPTG